LKKSASLSDARSVMIDCPSVRGVRLASKRIA
jgi:hypothetical protein